MTLFVVQAHEWFAHRPLRPGETVLITVQLADDLPVMAQSVSIEESDLVRVDTDAVRIPSLNEVAWRVRAGPGAGTEAVLVINGTEVRKTFVVGGYPSRVCCRRTSEHGFWSQLANPSEPPFPADSPVSSIEVGYPQGGLTLGPVRVHWLLAFLGLSVTFCFVLSRPFGVEL